MLIRCVTLLMFSLTLGGCAPAPGSAEPTVTVTGEGELSVTPEAATLELYVQARGRQVEPADSARARWSMTYWH